MRVLIVKDNLDIATKCMHKIYACLLKIKPRLTISRATISDPLNERQQIHCNKAIFLISSQSHSLEYIRKEWIGNLPKVKEKECKIILTDSKPKETHNGYENEEADDTVIHISNLEADVFKWWPQTLKFLFGIKEPTEAIDRAYCIHYMPNKEELVFYPMTKLLLDMLKTFGAHGVSHSERKKCCILVCTDAGMKLPKTTCTELSNQSVNIHAIAMTGRTFSDNVISHSDRQFNRAMTIEMIFAIMTELNLIKTKVNNSTADINISKKCTSHWLVIVGYMALILNLPAMIMHLVIFMMFPWPLFIMNRGSEADRWQHMHIGFVANSASVIMAVTLTSFLLYWEFFPILVSVIVVMYLLIWQIGVGLTLFKTYNYKYGIFSIPYELIWNKKKNTIVSI